MAWEWNDGLMIYAADMYPSAKRGRVTAGRVCSFSMIRICRQQEGVMALAYETDSDLAFDTDVLRAQGAEYAEIAGDLSELASDLDGALEGLAESGWSTPAGSAFHDMTDSGWRENIEKYVNLLNTLNEILTDAADAYDALVEDYIRTTKVKA